MVTNENGCHERNGRDTHFHKKQQSEGRKKRWKQAVVCSAREGDSVYVSVCRVYSMGRGWVVVRVYQEVVTRSLVFMFLCVLCCVSIHVGCGLECWPVSER